MAPALQHHHRHVHHLFPHPTPTPTGCGDPERHGELVAPASLGRKSDPSGAEPSGLQQPTDSALRAPLPLPLTAPPPSLSGSWSGRGLYPSAAQPDRGGGAWPRVVQQVCCRCRLASGPGADHGGRGAVGLGLPPRGQVERSAHAARSHARYLSRQQVVALDIMATSSLPPSALRCFPAFTSSFPRPPPAVL